jgi:hypothetical protein
MLQKTHMAGDTLTLILSGVRLLCRFAPHPQLALAEAGVAHAMRSDTSTVYHLIEVSPPAREFALKVMHPIYREPSIAAVCAVLRSLRTVPGLSTCNRVCVTPSIAPETLRRYPSLEYAVLMPWIPGTSWFDAHQGHAATESLSPAQCVRLATLLARVVCELEQREIVHSALSPPNLIVEVTSGVDRMELVGLEDIRTRSLAPCRRYQGAVTGYRHPDSPPLNEEPTGDRFGLAILLSEILTWHDDAIRTNQYSAESYFDVDELQSPQTARFVALHQAVTGNHPELGSLLRKAWESPASAQCPSAAEWTDALENLALTRIAYTWHRADPTPAVRPFPELDAIGAAGDVIAG